MTKKEYDNEKKRLEAEHNKQLKLLAEKYAAENNPVKIGDIIEDYRSTGRAISFFVALDYNGYPECVYKCEKLTKSGSQNKREPFTEIWQSHLKTINGEKYEASK